MEKEWAPVSVSDERKTVVKSIIAGMREFVRDPSNYLLVHAIKLRYSDTEKQRIYQIKRYGDNGLTIKLEIYICWGDEGHSSHEQAALIVSRCVNIRTLDLWHPDEQEPRYLPGIILVKLQETAPLFFYLRHLSMYTFSSTPSFHANNANFWLKFLRSLPTEEASGNLQHSRKKDMQVSMGSSFRELFKCKAITRGLAAVPDNVAVAAEIFETKAIIQELSSFPNFQNLQLDNDMENDLEVMRLSVAEGDVYAEVGAAFEGHRVRRLILDLKLGHPELIGSSTIKLFRKGSLLDLALMNIQLKKLISCLDVTADALTNVQSLELSYIQPEDDDWIREDHWIRPMLDRCPALQALTLFPLDADMMDPNHDTWCACQAVNMIQAMLDHMEQIERPMCLNIFSNMTMTNRYERLLARDDLLKELIQRLDPVKYEPKSYIANLNEVDGDLHFKITVRHKSGRLLQVTYWFEPADNDYDYDTEDDGHFESDMSVENESEQCSTAISLKKRDADSSGPLHESTAGKIEKLATRTTVGQEMKFIEDLMRHGPRLLKLDYGEKEETDDRLARQIDELSSELSDRAFDMFR